MCEDDDDDEESKDDVNDDIIGAEPFDENRTLGIAENGEDADSIYATVADDDEDEWWCEDEVDTDKLSPEASKAARTCDSSSDCGTMCEEELEQSSSKRRLSNAIVHI